MMQIARQDLVLVDWSWNAHIQRTERRNIQHSLLFTVLPVLMHGNACNIFLVIVLQTRCSDDESSVSVREEVRYRRLLRKLLPWTLRLPASEDAIIAAVKRELLKGSCNIVLEYGPSQSRLHKLLLRTVASISLLMERTSISRRSPYTNAVLRIAAIYCGRNACTNRF